MCGYFRDGEACYCEQKSNCARLHLLINIKKIAHVKLTFTVQYTTLNTEVLQQNTDKCRTCELRTSKCSEQRHECTYSASVYVTYIM